MTCRFGKKPAAFVPEISRSRVAAGCRGCLTALVDSVLNPPRDDGCGRLPRAKWALKVRNARNRWHLEIPAIQLIAPNLPDAANYEAERERGQDFESHHHC